jgi:hypothetical protein
MAQMGVPGQALSPSDSMKVARRRPGWPPAALASTPLGAVERQQADGFGHTAEGRDTV